MPDVFLSYSRENQPTARRFAESLQREGFDVWWDQTLAAGEHYDKVTERALREARAVVVLWSKQSVDSRWVRAEATIADRNGTLVPVMIEECTRPVMFELTQTAELSQWKGDANDKSWRAFVAGVRQYVNRLAPQDPVEPVPAVPQIPGGTAKPAWRVIAIALAALLLGGAGFAAWYSHRGDLSAGPSTTAPVTIAVVRFADYSEGGGQGYLADGLTEDLSTALSGIPDLTVIGRMSALEFKGPAELRAAFGDAPPTWLLEGSVRRVGKLLRVTAKLIEAKSGVQRWAQQYDRQMTDVFAIQQEIATAITTALRVPLRKTGARAAAGNDIDQEAYTDYLRARSLRRQLKLDEAIALLEAVVERHPKYAAAWAQLGYSYTLNAFRRVRALGADATDEQRDALASKIYDAAEQAARKAIELDGDLAEGYVALGYLKLRRRSRIEADELLRKALELDPALPEALQEYMVLLVWAGRSDKALQTGRKLLELEPFAPVFRGWVIYGLLNAGRPAEAIPLLQGIADDARDYGVPWKNLLLAQAYAATGDYIQSAAQLRRIAQVPGATAFIEGPLPAASVEQAARLIEKAPARAAGKDDVVLPAPLSFVYAYTGDGQRLLAAFRSDSAFRITGPSYASPVVWAPWMKELRATNEFRNQMREDGQVDYWKRFGWPDRCRQVGTEDFKCD